ncbi:hypothetical protein K0C01_12595 [Salinarchaeum sp. IM2453]|uniref:hypothetical protein n=1 Tax=Salinarchaeum sp. IM2453 TaxID=2862870 RepID=UPI001C82D515|nr:hypothetical protein [Salinarchaeum sp. IM2453]QZA88599.1 hypothetical protein K0C01_12595 [Salinarchaeum sp. IM2453]
METKKERPSPEQSTDSAPNVVVHQTCPGRVVFTETANSEAWIGTDLTVEVQR